MPSPIQLPRASSRRGRRGFTLTELMVAITGGLLVAIAVFALARDSSRFYQRESRMGDATSAVIIGFQRLQADIARAGYLSTANIQADPRLCYPTDYAPPSFPSPLKDLAPVRISAPEPGFEPPQVFLDPSASATDAGTNGAIEPDTLTLAGSYVASDPFPIWGATASDTETGGVPTVTLQHKIGPLSRNGYWANPGQRQTILDEFFPPGRILRVIDNAGKHFYGIIAQATVGSGGVPKVALRTTPKVQIRGAASTVCGLEANDLGTASVINVIRYELRAAKGDLATIAHLAPLYPDLSVADGGVGTELSPFEATRADLVRVELEPTGTAGSDVARVAASTEVIAEYAVDLELGITVVEAVNFQPSGPEIGPNSLRSYPPKDPNIAVFAGAPDVGRTRMPDRVRSVRVRLSVRSRMPDRTGNVDPSVGIGFRVFLPTPENLQPAWARVRTLQADVALRNTEAALWP
jgi:hypothetical protein